MMQSRRCVYAPILSGFVRRRGPVHSSSDPVVEMLGERRKPAKYAVHAATRAAATACSRSAVGEWLVMPSSVKRLLIAIGALIAVAAGLLGVGIMCMFGFFYPDFFALHWILTPSVLVHLPIEDKRDVLYFFQDVDGNAVDMHSVEFTTALAPEDARARLSDYFLSNGYSHGPRESLVREVPGELSSFDVGIMVDEEPHGGRYSVNITVAETEVDYYAY